MGNCIKKGTEDETTFYDGYGFKYRWDDGNRKGFTRSVDKCHFTQDKIRSNIFWADIDPQSVIDISVIVDEAAMLGSREQLEKIPEGGESQVREQWEEEPDGESDRQRPVPKRPTKGASKRSRKTVRGKSKPRRTKKETN